MREHRKKHSYAYEQKLVDLRGANSCWVVNQIPTCHGVPENKKVFCTTFHSFKNLLFHTVISKNHRKKSLKS